jgi:hypothetical protein
MSDLIRDTDAFRARGDALARTIVADDYIVGVLSDSKAKTESVPGVKDQTAGVFEQFGDSSKDSLDAGDLEKAMPGAHSKTSVQTQGVQKTAKALFAQRNAATRQGALVTGAGKDLLKAPGTSDEPDGMGAVYHAREQSASVPQGNVNKTGATGTRISDVLSDRVTGTKAKKAADSAGKIPQVQKRLQATKRNAKTATFTKADTFRQKARMATQAGTQSALRSIAAPTAVVALSCAGIILTFLFVAAALSGLMSMMGNGANSHPNTNGLPLWITEEMVIATLECQERYGDPAGVNLAQMLIESGAGDEPSKLAKDHNNIYGIKWYSGYTSAVEVKGFIAYATSEYSGEAYQNTIASFTVFNSMVDCINFRSRVMLTKSPYATNSLIIEARLTRNSDRMAEGLKDAGWATDISYVTKLKDMMDRYGLRRFDNLSVAEYQVMYSRGNASQQAVVQAATSGNLWGNGDGYCQSWVEDTLVQAGVLRTKPYICCATGAWEKWCVSTDVTNVPVGAVVFGISNPHVGGDCHADWGHIGIYIGNGQVANNRGGGFVSIDSFQWWTEAFHYKGWGWGGNVDLTQRG